MEAVDNPAPSRSEWEQIGVYPIKQRCTLCKASPGQPCNRQGADPYHATRISKALRARDKAKRSTA